MVVLDCKVCLKPDALKKLALKHTLTYLLHLGNVLWHTSKLLLCLVQLDVFFFYLLSFVVDLVLLLLKLFGLCFEVFFILSKAGPVFLVLTISLFDFGTHLLNALHFVAKAAVLFNKVLL